MKRFILVGRNSFLARHLPAQIGDDAEIIRISHDEIGSVGFDNADCVVNFACHPEFRTGRYRPEQDMDRILAERIASTGAHFVMLSTRMVYGLDPGGNIAEGAPTPGTGAYGRNKLTTEKFVLDRLGGRVTVLRLANIFGYEPGRPTFLGQAVGSLQSEKIIHLDIPGDAFRDFLPAKIFAETMVKIIRLNPPGIYNLGSGTATRVLDAASWLIEGFGEGECVIEPSGRADSFSLNVQKLADLIGGICAGERIRQSFVEIGKKAHRE